MRFVTNCRVWVRHAVHGWSEAEVVKQLDGGRMLLRMQDGTNFTAAGGNVRARNAAGLDAPDALEDLEHIDEPNVLHALRTRFKAGKFYTWAGHVLIATSTSVKVEPAPGDFPPDNAVSMTKKLLTRMATRETPQMVLFGGALGASAGSCTSRNASAALCQSLCSVGTGTAAFSSKS